MLHSLETTQSPPQALRRQPNRIVRNAERDELAALASAVAPQPLFIRYEQSGPILKRTLQAARDRGDGLIIVEDEHGCARGFAWFLRTGTFGSGGYLQLIALEPGLEGRGYGAALLDEVERRIAAERPLTAPTLFLLVSDWNHGARRFYASHDYQEVGRLPAFRRADTDEIVCMKRLPV